MKLPDPAELLLGPVGVGLPGLPELLLIAGMLIVLVGIPVAIIVLVIWLIKRNGGS